AASFGVLTSAAVGNTASGPVTIVRGDLGAGGGQTGFPPGLVTGTTYVGAAANPALAALDIAYANAKGRPAGAVLSATVGGTTAGPGVHTSVAAIANTGTFTIDAAGDPDAVFIFQVGGALAFAAGSHVVLTGGAQASNVFWVVTGAGAIGAGGTFAGTLMTSAAIGIGDGVIFNGRALSQTGAVTMTSTQFYASPPTVSIDGGTSAYTTDPGLTLTGSTSVRSPSTVTVTVNGETLIVTPAANGAWMADPVGLLTNGTYTVVASVVDGAGNIGTFSQTLEVDTTPPEVTIDGAASQTTNDLTPTISGTTDVDPGSFLTVTFVRAVPSATRTATTLVQSDRTWNVTPASLSAGVWIVTATASDPAGNSNSAVITLDIDVTAPTATIDGGAEALTRQANPLITGTALGATVTVSVDGVAIVGVTQLGATWSAQHVGSPLGHGTHHVSMTATDPAGNTTTRVQTLTVDTVNPQISINPGASDATNDTTPTISGTTDVASGPGVTVSVAIDGASPMIAVVQPDGWNVTPSAALTPGAHTVVATVQDPAGNIGTATQLLTVDITVPIVTILGGSARTTADATPTISGSSTDVPVGAIVTVQIAGQTLSTPIGAGGAFSVAAAAIAPNGTYFVFVTVADAAGNTGSANQSLTINAVAPLVAFTNGPTVTTSDATPLIAGTTTAPIGSAVVVTAAGQTLHATVQPGGHWYALSAHLAGGQVTVVASVTDLDGNVGTATQMLTVDSNAPTVLAIDGGPARATNDQTPSISGTTDAADGRVVTVAVGGQSLTTNASAGSWAVIAAPLADGVYAVNASVSAVGGNPGSAAQVLTISTVDPIVVLPGGPVVDTSDPTPPISGSNAPPGSTVVVTVGGQTLTTTVGPNGNWSVTPTVPLPPGPHTVTISITDPAGNVGSGTQIINIESVDPGLAVAAIVPVAPARFLDTRANELTFDSQFAGTGRLAAGTTVAVQVAGRGSVPADATGVVVNMTAIAPGAPGFATLFPCGAVPGASHVNYFGGDVVANNVVVPLSASGEVCVFTLSAADYVLDVNGYVPAGSPVGLFAPARFLDTRPGESTFDSLAAGAGRPAAGATVEVQIAGRGSVPADASAVMVNVTAIFPDGPGFATIFPCGELPTASTLNYFAGTVVPNGAITQLSSRGSVCVFTLVGADLALDVAGFVPAGVTSLSTITPARVLDTRLGGSTLDGAFSGAGRLRGGTTLTVQIAGRGNVPMNATAAILNVATVFPDGPGFVTLYPCGELPVTSNLNHATGGTVRANNAIT
ncbi:MAG: Ig-like domain-containing protein, partial [Ilumatobacteraceae bacterium]